MGSRSVSEDREEPEEPFHIRHRISHEVNHLQRERNEQRARDGPPRREVFHIGRRTIPSEQESTTPRSQTMRTEKERTGSDIELAIPSKKGSESAADGTTTESGSKHSSSKEAQKEGSVDKEK